MNMLIRFFMLIHLLKQQQLNQQSHGDASNLSSDDSVLTDSLLASKALTHEQLFQPFTRSYRILPHDMGFRDHLPNYRYLSFIEINVTGWLTQCLQAKGYSINEALKVKWIIAMQEMVYLSQIKLLNKMSVISTLEGWDEKYIYFQHEFKVKGQTKAIGLTKFILMDKTGKLTPELLDMTDTHLTDVIDTWNANQTAIKLQNKH